MSDSSIPDPQPLAEVAPEVVPYPSTGDQQLGGIELVATFFSYSSLLGLLLFVHPAKAVIDDGGELAHGWGSKVYPLPAGRHSVRVFCPYFFGFKMGDGVHELDVVAGQVTRVEWKCPWLVFRAGTFVPLSGRGLTQADLQTGSSAVSARAVAPLGAPAQNAIAPAAPAPAVSATPAGWHPDPQGQAALRYWDGTQWTEHVSDGRSAPA